MESDSVERTLYVANLDRNVTEEILYELFLQAGPLERISIPCGLNDSYRYGFVTYKHDCSVDYAIELYKGTSLFKKELLIKKKGAKSNYQQSNDNIKYPSAELTEQKPSFQVELRNFQQNFLLNENYCFQTLSHVASNFVKGNWSNTNRPYNRDSRGHSTRLKEIRHRHKERDCRNKLYHNRKNKHRD